MVKVVVVAGLLCCTSPPVTVQSISHVLTYLMFVFFDLFPTSSSASNRDTSSSLVSWGINKEELNPRRHSTQAHLDQRLICCLHLNHMNANF